MNTEFQCMKIEKYPEDGVAVLVLNRPQVLNALNALARVELYQAARLIEQDDDIRALVITGEGRAFCAGQDLNETAELPVDGGAGMVREKWITEGSGPYDAFAYFDKPVVAAIHGYTTGDGMQLALLADIRVAADDLRMGMTEVNVGLPCIWGSWLVSKVASGGAAAEITLCAELLSAQDAYRFGLVNRIASREEHLDVALNIARKIAAKPAHALRRQKQWLNEYFRSELEYVRTRGLEIHDENFGSGETQKIMDSFVKKQHRPTRK